MKLIGTPEVLNILGIKLPTLYAWVQRGKLMPYKVGKLLKFDEEEVRAMIAVRSVYAWLISGPRETAIDNARRLIGSQSPEFRLSYLQPPEPGRARVRIEAFDPVRMTWFGPVLQPEGIVFRKLENISKGNGYLFLGTPDPWTVIEFHPEETAGQSYLAAWIEKVTSAPARDLSDVIRRLEEGAFKGKVEPWTRDEIHERRRS